MLLETFRGPDLTALFRQARAELGEDALIVRTRVVKTLRKREFEVVTTTPRLVAKLRARVRAFPLPSVQQHRVSNRPPFVVALVGPEGSARTSTLAALASDMDAFAEWRVGVLAVSTNPSPMLTSMSAYPALRELQVEVASSSSELAVAERSMAGCDVILVQVQGGAAGTRALALSRSALTSLSPDETHLVLDASVSRVEAVAAVNQHRAIGASHLLLAQGTDALDEGAVLASVNAAVLPIRWIARCDPDSCCLQPAAERILGGLRNNSAAGSTGLLA